MPRFGLLTLLLTTAMIVPAAAQTKDVPVAAAIADSDPAVAATLQIQSDGQGVYTHQARYQTSIIQGTGEWELDLGMYTRGAGRKAFLGFDTPMPGTGPNGGPPVAPPSQRYVVRFVTKCWSVGVNMFFIGAGQTATCPLHVRFDDYNGNAYRLQMTGADEAAITCTATDAAARCNRWTVTPSGVYPAADGTIQRANVATLVKLVTKKGSTTDVVQGQFSFAFSISVAQ